MTDWFDHNQSQSENTPESQNTPETDPAEKKDTNSSASGWSTPDSQSRWSSDSGTADSSWNPTPASETPADSDSNQNDTTYRYGVNAPNPVPKNDGYTPPAYNSYNSPASGSGAGNGYQPQGNYDPYGWQRYQQNPQTGKPAKPPRKKRSGTTVAIAVLSVVCATTILLSAVLLAKTFSDKGLKQSSSGTSTSQDSNVTNSTENANAPSLQISSDADDATGLSTRDIVAKNLNSTVVITTYTNSSSSIYNFGTNNSNDSSNSASGTATGIIWTADGYIITNYHVVVNENTGKAYDRIDVETHDGTDYQNAQVIGADQYTDLAVIKISAANLSPATFGDSSTLQLGDKVVAIGNAGGLNWTTTQGIVSGLARDVYEDTGYQIKCLQIDAAINPGNSGGPLMNSEGQVVGINSAKIVASGYEGLGFSIPINEAKTIINDLATYGYVKGRVALGISGRTISQPGYEGFQIESITSDSGLNGTNAQVGDIITKVDGTAVTDYSTLHAELAKHSVGDTVELTLMRVDTRTGTSSTLTVKCKLSEQK